MRADLGQGLAFVRRSRYLILMLVWSALMNFATAGIGFVLVIVVAGLSDGQYLGPAMAIVATAGMAGAAVAPRLRDVDEDRLIRVTTACIVMIGIMGALAPTPVVMTACMAGVALLGPIIVVPKNARVYALVPDELMGRVQGALFLIGGCLYPFAAMCTGWLVEAGSPRVAMAAHTAVMILVLVISLLPQLSRSRAQSTASLGPARGGGAPEAAL